MIKECIVCNNKFETNKKAQKCCSSECSKIRKKVTDKNKNKKNNLICEYCGKQYTGNKGTKFCSKKCRISYRKKNLKVYICNCVICEVEFKSTKENSKYCSEKCYSEYRNLNPKNTFKCELCGKEFKSNKKERKFCSDYCSRKYIQDKKEIYTCQNCGKVFYKRTNGGSKNMFCSRECSAKYIIKVNKKHCLNCNAELKDRTKKYCSEECKIKHKEKEYTCKCCSETFKSTREKKYCSKECQLEANKKQMRERKKKLFIPELKKCKYCNNEFITQFKKSKTYCSDECKRKMNNLLSKLHDGKRAERIQRNGKIHNDITLKKLYKKHNGLCSICGEKCDYEDYSISKEGYFIANSNYPSIDHIIPIAKGGTHTWNNVQLAHRICNSIKNDNCKEVI